MSKIKGTPIGAGFILTAENDYFKIQSVSKNFSMRVNNTLPLWVACREAINNPSFRPTLQDMITMCYFPATIEFTPERYKKYIEFLKNFVGEMKGKESKEEDAESLEQVKQEYNLKKEFKENEVSDKPIYYRPHHGSFAESDAEKFIVKSLKDIEYFYKNEKEPRFLFIPTDLECNYYAQDSRSEIWFDTFIITGMINGQRVPLGFSSGMLK